MRRQDQRRERKKLERKKRIAAEGHRTRSSSSQPFAIPSKSSLPRAEVTFIPEGKPNKELFEIVKAAWSALYAEQCLDETYLKYLKISRRRGFEDHKSRFALALYLGQKLYDELANRINQTELRAFDAEVLPRNKPEAYIEIRVRELQRVTSTVMCSPLMPRLSLDGIQRVVAFNFNKDDHFIRRIEERTVLSPDDYASKGQAFNCLWGWQYFEVVKLRNGQSAVRLWNICDASIRLSKLWEELLPKDIKIQKFGTTRFYCANGAFAYYLVGYCPITEKSFGAEKYAVLNTLLLPGMRNTPEEEKLVKGKSKSEVTAMEDWIGQQTLAEISRSDDYTLTKMCHEIEPQVKMISSRVFHGFPTPPVRV